MAIDLHSIWGHRWLTPKANPGKSKMHVLGVIANKPISKDEIICVVGGLVVPRSQIKQFREKIGHLHAGFQIDEEFFLCPATKDEYKEFGVFNHTCDPNIGFRDSITLVAIRNIAAGEELAFDYAFSETDFPEFDCNCRTPKCRGKITPNDWGHSEIRLEYGKYFAPYIRRKFS